MRRITMQSSFFHIKPSGIPEPPTVSLTRRSQKNLIPNGIRQVYHANGSERVNSYKVNIVLPNNIMVQMVNVTEGDLNGAQVLIGMDIISLGDFALTHRNNGTVFSFQVPSTHEYDFVKQIQREREEQKTKRKKRR